MDHLHTSQDFKLNLLQKREYRCLALFYLFLSSHIIVWMSDRSGKLICSDENVGVESGLQIEKYASIMKLQYLLANFSLWENLPLLWTQVLEFTTSFHSEIVWIHFRQDQFFIAGILRLMWSLIHLSIQCLCVLKLLKSFFKQWKGKEKCE